MSTPAQQDPLVGKVLADRFEVLSRIGEGGTGVVYKAKQLTVDRVVAIKVLGSHVSSDPTWVKRFHNEARAAARLDHPNTVRLIDFGETKEGLLFIAMEFLQGRPLSAEIARKARLPPQRVLRIIAQVCQSLQEAHSQGIIHRDIKPDNIFLVDMKGTGDFVKVLDFSVAKLDGPDAQQTRAGTVFGTPAYMSPEQARGAKLTPHSDIYACGIVGYEMLTGKPPFEAALPMEVVMMHIQKRPAPLVGFPEPVAQLIMRALEKVPARRQQSAEELCQECQQVLEQLLPPAHTGPNSIVSGAGDSQSRPGLPSTQPAVPAVPPVPSAVGAPPPPSPQFDLTPPPTPPAPPNLGPPPPAPSLVPAAPPVAPPPNPSPVSATPEQRTVYGQAAPVLPAPPSAAPPAASSSANRTQALDAPAGGVNSTVYVPAPPGGSMTISPQALAIRQQLSAGKQLPPTPPRPLFWVSWALFGMCLGLLVHVLFTH